jgi:hypothetical protein
MIKNRRGSTLTAVIVVMLIAMTLMGGMTAIAYSYYMRSFDDNYTRQAKLCSQSACEVIGKDIHQADEKTDYSKLIPTESNEIIKLDNISLIKTNGSSPANVSNGVTMNGKIKLVDSKTIEIIITATYKTHTATSTLKMLKNEETDTNWQMGQVK